MLPVVKGGIVVLIGISFELLVYAAFGPMLFTSLPAAAIDNINSSTAFGANAVDVIIPTILFALASIPSFITVGLGIWWMAYSAKEEVGDINIVGMGRI